jgi:polyhydroxyalkanoate synthesis repressor PhaR
MDELRTVRKYSNRRLYDLAERRYVTLTELCARVVEGAELKVIDAETKEDITCAVLFQMMSAQEKRADPSMSLGFLLEAIRGGTGTPGWMLATFLEQSLNLFTTLQADRRRPEGEVEKDPMLTAVRLAEANYQRWCSVQSQIDQAVTIAESADLASDGHKANAIAPMTFPRSNRRLRRSPRQLGLRVQR